MTKLTIRLLKNNEIDTTKWDHCIYTSINGNVYSLSWYLNITCPDWEALVEGDYESVMPLTIERQWNRVVITQPAFTWQTGIFSNKILAIDLTQQFIASIPDRYKIKNITLNKFNQIKEDRYHTKKHFSTELDLIPSYAKLQNFFDPKIKKKLALTKMLKVTTILGMSTNEIIRFSLELDQFNQKKLKPSEIILLRQIISNSIRYRMGQVYAAYSRTNNLCAIVFFLKFKGKTSIHHVTADQEGLENSCIPLIIDRYIKRNAEKNLVLGNDNPNALKLSNILKSFGGKSYRFISLTRGGRLFSR